MRIEEYILAQSQAIERVGYGWFFKKVLWMLHCATFRGALFMEGDVQIQNLAGQGTLRILVGGLMMVGTSIGLTLAGVLLTLWMLLCLLASPLIALAAMVAYRRRLAREEKALEARIAAARESLGKVK